MSNEDGLELMRAARYLVKWAQRECRDLAKNEGKQDTEKLKWAKQVEDSISSLLFNLGKMQDEAIERGGRCDVCVFNIVNDVEWLQDLLKPEQEKVAA
jgi:hypothetical protein